MSKPVSLMISLGTSDLHRVSEEFEHQGCHEHHPLRLSCVSQSVWPATLLHGWQLQEPVQTGTMSLICADSCLSEVIDQQSERSLFHHVRIGCGRCLLAFPRLLCRPWLMIALLMCSLCCSFLRGAPVTAWGSCVTWSGPVPSCPLSCSPLSRVSLLPVKSRRWIVLSAATWRPLESAGLWWTYGTRDLLVPV